MNNSPHQILHCCRIPFLQHFAHHLNSIAGLAALQEFLGLVGQQRILKCRDRLPLRILSPQVLLGCFHYLTIQLRVEPRESVDGTVLPAIVPKRPPAAEELHSSSLLSPLPLANLDQTHLARGATVSASTGREVEIGDFNNANHSLPLRQLAKRQVVLFLAIHEVNLDRAILEDHPIRQVFDPIDILRSELLAVKVNSGALTTQMERDRLRLKDPDERLGEKMLTRVLLHVVKPQRPVDLPLHRLSYLDSVPRQKVKDLPRLFYHRQHLKPCQLSPIAGLSSRSRVEASLIQLHHRSFGAASFGLHDGVEVPSIGVPVIDLLGHERAAKDSRSSTETQRWNRLGAWPPL